MIEIKSLSKAFNGKPVLRQLDLTIKDGESIVIIGRSGCGKSVLLKHLIGLMVPDEGNIIIDAEDITQMREADLYRIRQKFGVLFQGAALFDSMTVRDNVALEMEEHTQKTAAEIDAIVAQKLNLVGLPEIQKLKPAELSGGMKKRVGLARAIACDPQYVLYDEPTTGLDPIMADIINELIKDLNSKLDVTSIIVTHDMVSAYKVADRIVMLHRGAIIYDGTPDQIRGTDNPTVRQFIEGRADGPIKPIPIGGISLRDNRSG